MKNPNIYVLADITQTVGWPQVYIGNEWVPARPNGPTYFSQRIRAAWLVFTGKADAVVWPKNQ